MRTILKPNSFLKKIEKGQKHQFIHFEQEGNTVHTQYAKTRLEPDNGHHFSKTCNSEFEAQLVCLEKIEKKLDQGFHYYVDGNRKDMDQIRKLISGKKERLSQRIHGGNRKRRSEHNDTPHKKKKIDVVPPNQVESIESAHEIQQEWNRSTKIEEAIISDTQTPIQEEPDYEIHYTPLEFTPQQPFDSLEVNFDQFERDFEKDQQIIWQQWKELEFEKARLAKVEVELKQREESIISKDIQLSQMLNEMDHRFSQMEQDLEANKYHFMDNLKQRLNYLLVEC